VLRSKLKPVCARTLTFQLWRSSSVFTRSCVLRPQRDRSVTRMAGERAYCNE
jgi:Zn ribbon nucleic-acid-binding protein